MKEIIKEFKWRGLIHDIVPGINKNFKKNITIYVGFDPTSDSLHIGNIIALIMLIHFKRWGYKTLIVIGGATGLIGDPSGRKKKRNILNKKKIKKNIKNIKSQINKILNIKYNKIKILNNHNWIKKISFLFFLKKIGKYITINYLMAKKSIKNRLFLKKNEGISFTEFSYQLIQAYDYFYLFKKKNCFLQIGGSDQWGNITTGIDLIKKKTGDIVYGLTFPLITKRDGKKMGKSENKKNIWINSKKTSFYDFYQFWINCSDYEAEKFIKIYTFLSKKEIDFLIFEHRLYPNKKLLQKKLALEITNFIHGKKLCKKAIITSNILFGKYSFNFLKKINESTFLSLFGFLPIKKIKKNIFIKGLSIKDALFTENGKFFSSKNEILRSLKENSISVNKNKVKKNFIFNKNQLIAKKYFLIKKGKKKFFVIKII